jgi:hypothetical protein
MSEVKNSGLSFALAEFHSASILQRLRRTQQYRQRALPSASAGSTLSRWMSTAHDHFLHCGTGWALFLRRRRPDDGILATDAFGVSARSITPILRGSV